MNNISETVIKLSGKSRTTKAQFLEIVESSIEQINEIKKFYGELKTGSEENPAIISEIETKYEQVANIFNDLFIATEGGEAKAIQLNKMIEEVKNYHKELLSGEESIKIDIQDSREHINGFYNFLFEDGGKGGGEKKIKNAMEVITKFEHSLAGEEGLEAKIKEAYKKILETRKDLFESEEGQVSKVLELDQKIEKIVGFETKVQEEIKPKIESVQQNLKEIKADIDKKSKDINSLLTSATGGALAEGYRESMEEYSKKSRKDYPKKWNKQTWHQFIRIYFINNWVRHSNEVINHLLFIFPLIGISLILWNPEFINDILGKPEQQIPGGFDFILYKAMLTLPLFWVSWFGQQNISKRKRLFEEYNHKLRVSQMYLLFNAKENNYDFDKREDLENILIEAIKINPAEYLGKGETLIDNMLEKFKFGGFYKQLKSELLDDMKLIIPKILEKQNK